jgi:hypothetical protein
MTTSQLEAYQHYAQKVFNPFGQGLAGSDGRPDWRLMHRIAAHMRPQRQQEGRIPFVLFASGTHTVATGGSLAMRPGFAQNYGASLCIVDGAATTPTTTTYHAFEGEATYQQLAAVASGFDIESSSIKVWNGSGEDAKGFLSGGSSTVSLHTGAAYRTYAAIEADADGMGFPLTKGITVIRGYEMDDPDDTPVASRTTFHATSAPACAEKLPFVELNGATVGDIIKFVCVVYGSLRIAASDNCVVRVYPSPPCEAGETALYEQSLVTPFAVSGFSFKKVVLKMLKRADQASAIVGKVSRIPLAGRALPQNVVRAAAAYDLLRANDPKAKKKKKK